MSSIKAVLFDAGNTLLDFRPSEDRAIEIVAQRTGRQVSEAEAAPFFEAAFHHAFGDGTLWVTDRDAELRYWTTYYQGWLGVVGVAPDADLIAELIDETLNPQIYTAFPDSQPVLDKLREQGIKIALISNAFPSMRLLIEHNRLDEYLDPAIYSCEVGFEKPQMAIFQLGLRGLGTLPGETVFVDDLPSNIEAAMSLGIRGLLLDRWDRHSNSPWTRIKDLYAVLDEVR